MSRGREHARTHRELSLGAAVAACGLLLAAALPGAVSARDAAGSADAVSEIRVGAAPRAASFDAQRFATPLRSDGPWTRWWWPGNDVDPGEIRREIDLFARAGFAGVEIQPVAFGLPTDLPPEQRARIHSVDTARYYANLAVALEAAQAAGISVDVTNGSSWPTGSAIVPADDGLRVLAVRSTTIDGSAASAVDIPEPPGERVALVAARIVRESGRGRRRRVRLDAGSARSLSAADGATRVDFAPRAGRWEIIAVGSAPSGRQVLLHPGSRPAYVVDHFSGDDVSAHLGHLFGPRTGLPRFFGRALHGVFNDSFELAVDRHYAEDLIAEFRRRRGYDVTRYLPTVLRAGYNNGYRSEPPGPRRFSMGEEIDERVMFDYDLTLSDLFVERFLERTRAWADAHGLVYRAQPYGLILDVIRAAGAVSVPEAEQLYAGGHRLFVRLVASGAELHGANVVSAEALVFPRRDYEITPQRIKEAVDGLFSAGVNQIVYHGSPYRYAVRDADVAPWNPWSTPLVPRGSFSTVIAEADHFWKYQHLINAYVARIQYALQLGTPDTDVLVYYPYLGARGLAGERTAHEGTGRGRKRRPNGKQQRWRSAVLELTGALEERGMRWAFANDASLQTARARDGAISLRGRRYAAVIVAAPEWIQVETATALRAIAEAGATVILHGAPPARQPGLLDYRTGDRRVAEAMAAIARARTGAQTRSASDVVASVPERAGRIRFATRYPTLKHAAVALPDGDAIVFLHNVGHERLAFGLRIPATLAGRCSWLDPTDGRASEAPAATGPTIRGALEAAESRLLHCVRDESTGPEGSDALPVDRAREDPFDGDVELVARLDRFDLDLIEGGKTRPLSKDDPLADWSSRDDLRFSAATGVYTTETWLDVKRPDSRYLLDLGVVHSAAEVTVNGAQSKVLLFEPHRVDVTEAIRAGRNHLRIEVTPPTLNGLIGRARGGEAALAHLAEGRAPVPAGLVGPVRLLRVERERATSR